MFKNKEIVVTLPGKDVRISKKEYQVFAPFQENEKIMRLLTGQLGGMEKTETAAQPQSQPQAQPQPQVQPQQDQTDMLAKLLQNNPNLQNLNGIAEMQNLMNNQLLQGLNPSQPSATQNSATSMMASMMGMGAQTNPMSSMQQNQGSNLPLNGQNLPNDQLLNNLMSSNLPWNVGQNGMMGSNLNGMDNKSLNDLINSQMMNFNGNFMGGQDQNQNNN